MLPISSGRLEERMVLLDPPGSRSSRSFEIFFIKDIVEQAFK
jgi:hypothetical protein